jgi:hypothetical protein
MSKKRRAMALLAISTAAFGQSPPTSVVDSGEARFRQSVEMRFPTPLSLTDAARFVLNHSALAIPLLRNAIEKDLNAGLGDSSSVTKLAEMIAYAANTDAVDAISELCASDEGRFSPMVSRVLNHAITRKREFEVAAYAAENHPLLRKYVGDWLGGNLMLPLSEELLAQSVLKHEAVGDRNPRDFLLPLLSDGQREHFKTTLEHVRRSEREKGQRRQ